MYSVLLLTVLPITTSSFDVSSLPSSLVPLVMNVAPLVTVFSVGSTAIWSSPELLLVAAMRFSQLATL